MNMRKLIDAIRKILTLCHGAPQRNDKMHRLKIYTFQEDAVWYLHVVQKHSMEELRDKYSCQYRVRLVTDILYGAALLRQAYQEGSGFLSLTGYLINPGEIIEIEDWPQPVFFYVQPGNLVPIKRERIQQPG